MKKNLKEKLVKENKLITKCIFYGLTIAQIAKVLHYSQSTVSNRLAKLFSKYSAKTRCEFILGVLGEVIDKNNIALDEKQVQIEKLNERVDTLTNILKKLNNSKNNSKELEFNFNQAEKILKSFTY